MRDGAQRRPGAVPDDGRDHGDLDAAGPWVTDTDADGRPDTLLTADGADLLVLTDLDGDGLADRVLRIGPDASVHVDPAHPHTAGPVAGHAPAAHGPWAALLGRLFGLDP